MEIAGLISGVISCTLNHVWDITSPSSCFMNIWRSGSVVCSVSKVTSRLPRGYTRHRSVIWGGGEVLRMVQMPSGHRVPIIRLNQSIADLWKAGLL